MACGLGLPRNILKGGWGNDAYKGGSLGCSNPRGEFVKLF